MTIATPALRISHSDRGSEVSVAATWPDGRCDTIPGFRSESEANDWIATRFQTWMDKQAGRPRG